MKNEAAYLDLLARALDAPKKRDRTGTGTHALFGAQMRFDLQAGFPLLTTKKMHLKSIIHELLWFLSGDTNVRYLQERGVRIWNEWADAKTCAQFGRKAGDLGPIYGHQWRNFGASYKNGAYQNDGLDQMQGVIDAIKTNPDSRRLIVSGWNPLEVNKVSLPPCHTLFQFFVLDGVLSCQLYQRSADLFLGVPFNIASYALLTHMVAQVCNLDVGEFIWSGGDCHLYQDHTRQARLQLERTPLPPARLVLNGDVQDLFAFTYEDIQIKDYQSHGAIVAQVSV